MNDSVPVNAVLCTVELQRRIPREPDFASENHALVALVQGLADSPDSILQTMVDAMLTILDVGSAGCSVIGDDHASVGHRWAATSGIWKAHTANGPPRADFPCAELLNRNVPWLGKLPQRRYSELQAITPPIEECLVVPFHEHDAVVGALWLVSHDANRRFDMEDLRLLLSLSKFASSAYHVTNFSQCLRSMNEALLLGSLEQHEAAEAEERLNVLLRAEIAARTALELDLQEATIKANQASVSKSDFLANMSHELRTPLSAILGHAQIMELGTSLTEIQKRSITQIKKGGWYLADLINEILDLAQIEAGKMSLRLEAISLAEILHECQTLIEPLAKQHEIALTIPHFESAVFVLGDSRRIRQVLINLLSNAIKYNRPGGNVTVECRMAASDRHRISVRDTGAGLSEEQVAQLFQLFNRLGQDALRVNGTGIGLVMTKRLTELMGGTIGVESSVGQGSTFWIELKQAPIPEVQSTITAPTRYLKSKVASQYLKTLLYVEDNPANLLMVQDLMVHRPDIRLLTALDGTSGIAAARANLPDAILLDMRLPDISGLQVAAILAADPPTARIPVVAFSANAMPQDVNHAMAAGFFHYLTKPINVGEFMETLDSALGLPTEAA